MTDWAWHVHHDILLELLTEPIEARQEYIRTTKDPSEVDTRLRLLKPVVGPIPDPLVKAGEAYDKARKARAKAGEAHDKAWEAYGKAREAYVKAGEAPDVLALHAKECPDCPWDGRTIIP